MSKSRSGNTKSLNHKTGSLAIIRIITSRHFGLAMALHYLLSSPAPLYIMVVGKMAEFIIEISQPLQYSPITELWPAKPTNTQQLIVATFFHKL